MHLYFSNLNGFTDQDIEMEIKSMTRQAMQAKARAAGLQEAAEQLKNMLINRVLENASIKAGDKCVVHFTDGDRTVQFLEAASGEIVVRPFGVKGKPYKYNDSYPYTYADLFEKCNK